MLSLSVKDRVLSQSAHILYLERLVCCCNGALLHVQALKEAYLPESGIWIAKYPFVDRDVFLDISLDIARERQSEQPAQWSS